VELDAVGYSETVPAQRDIAIVSDCFIRSRAQRGSERKSDSPLERITSDVPHLALDCVETLTFALPDFDGQELKEVTISVGGSGAGSFGSV
jgi:hypothetical protein